MVDLHFIESFSKQHWNMSVRLVAYFGIIHFVEISIWTRLCIKASLALLN